MPFLKSNKLHVQRFTDYTVKKTIINGYRPLVVQSANVQYTGEWKNGRKNGRDEFVCCLFYSDMADICVLYKAMESRHSVVILFTKAIS